MWAKRAVLAAVLGSIAAGTGCCKLCDWCTSGSSSRPEGVPPRTSETTTTYPGQVNQGQVIGAVPSSTVQPQIPATTQTPTGPTGAYGGTGN